MQVCSSFSPPDCQKLRAPKMTFNSWMDSKLGYIIFFGYYSIIKRWFSRKRCFLAKSDHPRSIMRINMLGRENQLPQVVLWPTCILSSTRIISAPQNVKLKPTRLVVVWTSGAEVGESEVQSQAQLCGTLSQKKKKEASWAWWHLHLGGRGR